MHNKIRKIIFILTFLFVSQICTNCFSETISMDILLTGETKDPVTVSFVSPEYKALAQYGEDRLGSLNRLLRHFAIRVNMDHNSAETIVSIDEDALFAVTEETDETGLKRSYSIAPEVVFEEQEVLNDTTDTFGSFLDSRFFALNRILDELYTVFEKSADAFPEMAGSSSANLNFSGFGKAVRRITIAFSADYVKEHFPTSIMKLCPADFSREVIENLVFQGAQKMVLLFDKEDYLIRINYDGIVGKSEESLRKVSVVWKCLRTDSRKKDSLTLKTPAIKGYDKDNIVFERELDCSDPLMHILKWDYQLDLKAGQEKEKAHYSGDLLYSDDTLTGKVVYTEKADNQEHSISFIPFIQKEKEDEYSGTLEITKKTGKIIKNSSVSRFSISSHNSILNETPEKRKTDIPPDLTEEKVQQEAIRMLIRKMVMLPKEDTEFLNKDIPEDMWYALIESLI